MGSVFECSIFETPLHYFEILSQYLNLKRATLQNPYRGQRTGPSLRDGLSRFRSSSSLTRIQEWRCKREEACFPRNRQKLKISTLFCLGLGMSSRSRLQRCVLPCTKCHNIIVACCLKTNHK